MANRRQTALTLGIFVVALCLYAGTALPDVLPADAGEFQLVSTTAGVAHPPGYPLYTMMGWLATRIPLGPSPAWRVNLLSALISAATVALVYRTGRRLTGSTGGGLVAALALGSATTFWATATQASIRPLMAFFTAACLDAVVCFHFAPEQERDRYLIPLAGALSLGLTHHASLAFVGLVCAIYLLWKDPRLAVTPRRWWRPLLATLPGLVVLIYLPLRAAAEAPLAPSDLTTLDGFLEHVLGRGFRGDMFAFATPEHLPARLSLLPTLLMFQFNQFLVLASGLGAMTLLWRERRLALLLVGSFLVHTFVVLTYRAPQTVEYEMPAYVALALLVAAPLRVLREVPGWRVGLAVVLAGASAVNLVSHLPSYVTLTRAEDTRATLEPILEQAPADALVLADWHWATPMWYLQQVEGARPDLDIRYVYPVPGQDYAQVWLQQIESASPGQAVIVTHRFTEIESAGHTLHPMGFAYLLDTVPALPAANLLGVTLGDNVILASTSSLPSSALPGAPIEVTLAWTIVSPPEEQISVFVHLVGPDGRLWGQGRDRTYLAEHLTAGGQLVERFVIVPYMHALPGRYTLVAGAYHPQGEGWARLTTAGGNELVPLGDVTLHPAPRPPASSHRFILPRPLGSQPALVGVDYDTSWPGQLRVYLHWRSPSDGGTAQLEAADTAPISITLPETELSGYFTSAHDLPAGASGLRVVIDDRTVRLPSPQQSERYIPFGGEIVLRGLALSQVDSLEAGAELEATFDLLALRPLWRDRHVTAQLIGEGYTWRIQDDGTPALGAIPTFKWIANSRVADRRALPVPPNAGPGTATLYLGIYDAFSNEPLPVLDERFIEYGGSLPLATFTITSN